MGNVCTGEGDVKTKSRGISLGGGGSGLGAFLAGFAADNEGEHVASELQGTTECWDLAMAAIEHAQAAGYEGIDWQPESSYEWGPNVVDVSEAQPGDIVQWTSYTEQVTHDDGSWESRSAGFPNHTSIVAEAYDGEVLKCWGQNPDPVTLNEYHPDSCTGGSFIIYRLECAGGGTDDVSTHDEDDGHHDDDDGDWEYCDSGKYPYYWKAAEGYDPYHDGYYWYWEDPGNSGIGSPDTAEWHSYN
eukprot:gnl/MRDRNA2_/MRDRNA2_96052_c0_seq1.p1 gnl/MRDRNA2_/MRDRNA2_96052_c0~~gnl/MRDRNA2_/MRDRNA2_96052_c0_seq1.p1  ORF type:complete len:244 (-),score=44.14 gnl/MRDRNA2_/MRDRNA2_96052_c0_seq1:46-777(-)